MRSSAVVLATTFAACSSPPGPGIDPPSMQPDGGTIVVDGATTTDAAPMEPPPPTRGFRIASPDVPIYPGDEVTFCYYFQTPNTTELAVKKWASHMTPGSHHLIVFFTPTMLQRPGTMTATNCGFGSGGPVWTYSAQTADAATALPLDDGGGKPVAQPVKAGQYGFLQVHFLNATDAVIQAHVQLDAFAHDEGVQYTPAGPFVTFNDRINLAPGTPTAPTRGMVSGTCDFRSMAGGPYRFYAMSTHTHKQGVRAFVTDGSQMVLDNASWDHPLIRTWDMPFFTFPNSTLTYQCDYVNPNNRTIVTGNNADTDEMCMVVGYYFPAPGGIGHLCWDEGMVY
ncbi:MAG TPA: hypothetical protein VFD36_23545 [Kofleriaceae bacterium]|nr:hypothetical protein [Kofleriaceae bacterium]